MERHAMGYLSSKTSEKQSGGFRPTISYRPNVSGFDFRVTSLPGLGSRAENGSCDTVVEGGEGEGSLISLEHWHPPGTRCSTTLRGRDHQVLILKQRLNKGSRRFHNHGEGPYKA